MVDREPVKLSDLTVEHQHNRTREVGFHGGDGISDPPDPSVFNPIIPSAPADLVSSSAARTLTFHAEGAPVAVMLGGPLTVGGFVIFAKLYNNALYIDFALGEGPTSAVTNIKFGGKDAASLGISTEIHLGVAGDTTSTFITAAEATYTIPEYVAHVACIIPQPTTATGDYNPLAFTCDWTGQLCYDPRTATTIFTKNPYVEMFECFKNDRFGLGSDVANELNSAEWQAMANAADVVISGTTKRFEMSMRCDSVDTFESWFAVWRLHCQMIAKYEGGRWGGIVDLPRARALDPDGNAIVFRDYGDLSNVLADIVPAYSSSEQLPTVVIAQYTDASNGFIDASVMFPPTGPAVGQPWIEKVINIRGTLTIDEARRHAAYVKKTLSCDVNIPIKPGQIGMILAIGDRTGVDARYVCPTTFTPPNSGATAGIEEVVIADLSVDGDGKIVVHCTLYRDDNYDDTYDASGPPTPGPLPDPYATPDDPSGLVAAHAGEDDYGKIEFTGALSPFTDYYEVLDLYGSPADPPVVATISRGAPKNSGGKYTAFVPALIHGTPSTSRHLFVMVRTVTQQTRRKSAGVSASWDVGSTSVPRTKVLYGKSVQFKADGVDTPSADTWSGTRGISAQTTVTKVVDSNAARDSRTNAAAGSNTFQVYRSLHEYDTSGVLPADAVITGIDVELYSEYIASGLSGIACILHATAYGGPVQNYPYTALFDGYKQHHQGMGADFGSFPEVRTYDQAGGANPPSDGYIKMASTTAGAIAAVNVSGKTHLMIVTDNDFNNNTPAAGSQKHNLGFRADAAVSPGPRLTIHYTSATEDNSTANFRVVGMVLIGTGTGAATVFTMPEDYIDLSQTIYLDGVGKFETTHYTRSGTGLKTITFGAAPGNLVKVGASYAKVN